MKTKMTDQTRSLEDECEFLNDKIAQLEKEIEMKAVKYVNKYENFNLNLYSTFLILIVIKNREKMTIKNMTNL